MPKIKTHSGAKKRFKLSKNGKPIRAHANKSHILTKKVLSVKEICVRLLLQIKQMKSKLSVLFLINKRQAIRI